ncbi:MAG: hypothetical protein J5I92_15160 [Thiogranum sp.]|nr:hypothetical protein [Thiogranum sp.]
MSKSEHELTVSIEDIAAPADLAKLDAALDVLGDVVRQLVAEGELSGSYVLRISGGRAESDQDGGTERH